MRWLFQLAPILAGLVAWHFVRPLVADATSLEVAAQTLAGVDATLLGFLVSAGALLYAVANTKLVRNLQRTGHFNRLLNNLFVDCFAFLVALVAAVTCLFVKDSFLIEGMAILIALNVVALCKLLHVGINLWALLLALEPEGKALEL